LSSENADNTAAHAEAMYAPEQPSKKYRDDAKFSHAFFPVPVISGPEDSNSDT
jgi:hypothetical protein